MSTTETIKDMKNSPLGEVIEANEALNPVTGEVEREASLKDRVALTTAAAWQFTSKAPRWAKRKAAKAKKATPGVIGTAKDKIGQMWSGFRSFLAKIDFLSVGVVFAFTFIWAIWNMLVWYLLLWCIAAAMLVNPIFGWCVAVVVVFWGISFTFAYTANLWDKSEDFLHERNKYNRARRKMAMSLA